MLGDDELGLALLLDVAVVAVDEDDHVRVLFDAAALTQVGELRTLVRSTLRVPVELGERHHRDTQLLREQLERAADLGDLLLAVVGAAGVRAGHELHVVDDDEVQARAARAHAAGLRADVDDVHVAGVDDVQGRVVQDLGRVHDVRPVVGPDALVPDAIPRHARLRAEQTHADLEARHLEGEERDRLALNRHVAGDVRGQGRLPDARTGGDDHEVPRLKPRREVVEIAEPTGQPRVGGVAVLDGLEVDHGLVDQVAQDRDLVLVLAPGDVVDALLGVVGHALGVIGRRVGHLHDVGRGADEPAQQRGLRHDAGVVAGRCGRGDLVHQVAQVEMSADLVEDAASLQRLDDRDDVDRLAARVDGPQDLVDPGVRPR